MDAHSRELFDAFLANRESFEIIRTVAMDALQAAIARNNIYVTATEARVKSEQSLAEKLDRKGQKYKTLEDVTDLVGLRIITFYTGEVDKIAAIAEQLFTIDWDNSVDKRQSHNPDQFGYLSLHYICRIPPSLYSDPEHPEVNHWKFELQMRTALQHVWATVYHDTGYKSDVEVPREYIRGLNRLAGLLELADEQFDRIMREITDYRRQVGRLVQSGAFETLALDGDTFREYLAIKPFQRLNERIAAINRSEIAPHDFGVYLPILLELGIRTIGQLEDMKNECGEDAYRLAMHQLGGTELDILSETVGIQNLCIVRILKDGLGVPGLKRFYDRLQGERERNLNTARRLYRQAEDLGIVKKEE